MERCEKKGIHCMTFILNVLNKDFSLIASDRKGTTEGPVTLEANGRTINIVSQGTITIEGVKKIHTSMAGSVAVGHAGNTSDHGYANRIGESESIREVLNLIRENMGKFLLHDYKHILETESFTNNQGIAAYYESDTNVFFSNYFEFSPIHNYMKLYSGSKSQLIHAGSGGLAFESAVGLEEIDRFIASLQSSDKIPSYLEWMREAYKKVSAVDEGSGERMIVFVSTKENPCFVEFPQTD